MKLILDEDKIEFQRISQKRVVVQITSLFLSLSLSLHTHTHTHTHTRLLPGLPGFSSPWEQVWNFFSPSPRLDRLWGPNNLLSNVHRVLTPGAKRSTSEADHSSPSSAEVKNAWSYTRVYPKLSGLAAWSENCIWFSSLPLGAVV
jgi:hypothetical protein